MIILIINLIRNLATADYFALYLVRSSELLKANIVSKTSVFDDIVRLIHDI